MARMPASASLPASVSDRAAAGSQHLWPDVSLILLLSLLPCFFFWRLITPNPADRMQIAGGDFTEQYFPLRAFAAEEWVRGRVPLWNPYLYGGQPALADIQSGALYPPHVIEALILGWGGPLFGREVGFPLWALEWQVILHFSLASVGTYLFVRHTLFHSSAPLLPRPPAVLRRARFGGLIAALVFAFGGYLTGFPVQQMTILEASSWLPWVLWGLSAALWQAQNGGRFLQSLGAAAWAALAFALAILAGHPQTGLYIFYLTLAYALFRAFDRGRSRDRSAAESSPSQGRRLWPFLAASLGWWGFIILLGAAMAAAQLLPTLEFIARSVRSDLSYQTVSTGLPLNEFVSILYPGFFGGSPEYVGIVSLVLIGLALVLARPRAETFFWAGAGLVGFLLAFGDNTFLYAVFYLLAPGFEAVRQQERAFLIYSFSAAVLAGYGAMVLVGPLTQSARVTYGLFLHRLRVVTGVAMALTAFFIYGSAAATARGDEVNLFFGVLWHHIFGLIILIGLLALLALRPRRWLRRSWGMALIAIWLAFNLFTVNWRFNLEQPSTSPPFSPNGTTQYLDEALRLQPGRIASGGRLPGGNSAASVFGFQDLTGNTPLHLAAVDTFFREMPAWRLWQLMNVRYILDDRDIGAEGLPQVFAEGDLRVYEMGDPFPRAWFVSNTEVAVAESAALSRLAADSFDLRTSAITAEPLDTPLDDASVSSVSLVSFSPTRLTAAVEATGQHLLVFSQIHDPGWQAAIEGRPMPVRRVNVIQQGIVIPEGDYIVELTYRPDSFRVGTLISAGGLMVCLAVLLLSAGWFQKRPQAE